MRNKIIVATLLAGALSTAAFAHGNNMSNSQGMHNGMNDQPMNNGINYQYMHNKGNQGAMQNQQNMMYMMHNMMHNMMNSSQNSANIQGMQNCLNTQVNMQGHQNMMGIHNGMKGNYIHSGSNNQAMHKGMIKNNMMHNSMALLSKLNLTNDQKNKLSTLYKEMFNEMQKVMHPTGFKGMMDFIDKDGFDKESFKKTMNTRHKNMMDFKINHMDKVLKVLTKEQLFQLSK